MAVPSSMATPRIKTTYSLPVETVAALDRLASRWGVSRSEALVRAVASVDEGAPTADALAALDAWQSAIGLDAARVRAWEAAVAEEREARGIDGVPSARRVAERRVE
jgi:hypothetical protein